MEATAPQGTLLGDYTVRITHPKQLDDGISFELSDRIDDEWEKFKNRLEKLAPGIEVKVD